MPNADPQTERSNERHELYTRARNTPLARPNVVELAKTTDAALLEDALPTALTEGGIHAATVLAFATIAAGKKLDLHVARLLLAEVEAAEHFGPIAYAASPSTVEALVAYLDDARGGIERDALAVLIAADSLAGAPAPSGLLIRARNVARHDLPPDEAILFGAAVAMIDDAQLASLAAPFVAKAKRAKRVAEVALAKAKTPALEILGETAAPRVTVGYTVKRETPDVGRNDPCPCGSGKKYKKCHGGQPEQQPGEAPKIEPETLGPEQTQDLRTWQIAQLDVARLSSKVWLAAYRRVLQQRDWNVAWRMLENAETRTDLTTKLDDLLGEALDHAYAHGARDFAEQVFSKLGKEAAEREGYAMAFLRKDPSVLTVLETEAHAALRDEADGGRAIELAYEVLRHFPALGVFVARGAMHEGRPRDCESLLELVEDARDRLLVSPFEVWWDVYEAMTENAGDRREARAKTEQARKMQAALRKARADARKASAELSKLQAQVEALDTAIEAPKSGRTGRAKQAAPLASTPASSPTPATTASPELVEERRRLKTKIDELQRIIGEGQEERRELRRLLAEQAELAERDDARDDDGEDEDDDRDDDDDDASPSESPRGILVPRWADRAAKALTDLDAAVADAVLVLVAALAAGRLNAWGGVKQLVKIRGFYSARAGIHHRVLFTLEEGALEVVAVIHRRELEQTVARLARSA